MVRCGAPAQQSGALPTERTRRRSMFPCRNQFSFLLFVCLVLLFWCFFSRGEGLANWWEHWPRTNVARDRYRPGTTCGLPEFVVDSGLALRPGFSSGFPVFLHKNQHSKFEFEQDRGFTRKPAETDVVSSLNIAIFILSCPKLPVETFSTSQTTFVMYTTMLQKKKRRMSGTCLHTSTRLGGSRYHSVTALSF